jgi:prepilin signal peptidase PulO-like enzyme (type II secretory pathway)
VSRTLAVPGAPPAGAAVSNTTWLAALTAGWVGVFAGFARFGFDSHGVVIAVLLGSVAALAVIDFRHQVVPSVVVLPAAAAVLALRLALFSGDSLEWVLAALATSGLLLAFALLKRDSLSTGDAKVGFLLGAGLGVDVAVAMLIGVLALWPFAAYLVWSGDADARKQAIPLTPALALGAAIVALS